MHGAFSRCFSNGVFGLWEMPDFNNIRCLSISQAKIDGLAVSSSGDGLGFASSKLGQLLVWEW
jgi:periodic tryptophan protein 2